MEQEQQYKEDGRVSRREEAMPGDGIRELVATVGRGRKGGEKGRG